MSFACRGFCKRGYKRVHFRCVACKDRKWHYYDLDRSKYIKTGDIILPKKGKFVILFANRVGRRYAKIKDALLVPLLTLCQVLMD